MDATELTLAKWILNKGGDSESGIGRAEKFLDLKVIREVGSYSDYDAYLTERLTKARFRAANVHCFVVLENGYAVGLNENPAKGLSFPVVKYGESKTKPIITPESFGKMCDVISRI